MIRRQPRSTRTDTLFPYTTLFRARLGEFELAATGDDFFAEGDGRFEDRLKPHHFGAAAADREHVGGEARLRRGVAPELVEHDLGGRVALQFDDDAHALAVRFVADVGDAFDPLVACGLGDLFRSEEHTSELQSLMRISYAAFCLKHKTTTVHK